MNATPIVHNFSAPGTTFQIDGTVNLNHMINLQSATSDSVIELLNFVEGELYTILVYDYSNRNYEFSGNLYWEYQGSHPTSTPGYVSIFTFMNFGGKIYSQIFGQGYNYQNF
jgi:hypothetical protein